MYGSLYGYRLTMIARQPNSLPSALYRKLALGQTIDDDDLQEIKNNPVFCFNAVISKNANHSDGAACTCAREHEYFGHITNDGNIDTVGLDKICVWIDNGQCPHVENLTPDEEVHPTAVTAIHVAIAAKRKELYEYIPRACTLIMYRDLIIFNLSNIHLATIKQTRSYLEFTASLSTSMEEVRIDLETPFYNAEQITAPFHVDVIATRTNVLKLCIRRNDIQTLQCLLDLRPSNLFVKSVVACSIYIGTDEMTKTLLEYTSLENIDNDMIIYVDFTSAWTTQAILNNKPGILKLLKENGHLATKVCGFGFRLDTILDFANMFGFEGCVRFLKGFMTRTPDDVMKVNPFLVVLKHTTHTPHLCIRLLTRLRDIGHDINQTDYSGQTAFMSVLRNNGHVDAQVIEALLKLGSDVDLKDSDGHSAIMNLLAGRYDQIQIRDKLILLLLCNPQLDDSSIKACVNLAFRYDCRVAEGQFLRTYLCNQLSSTPVGHMSDRAKPECILPLLWENGYPVTQNIFLETSVPEVLLPMLHHMACKPRPLKMFCRTKLRQRYAGAALQKFVMAFDCPWIIQDYILMTYLKE